MNEMKEKIAHHARKLFDEHGYHGAALRDVCKLAGCKMPTIYYYYENKEKLFDEVVRVSFEDLVSQLWEQLPEEAPYREHCIAMVKQKKQLTENERTIYRLALKTWLGFESCSQSRQKLMEWEQDTYQRTWINCKNIVGSAQWAKFIARSITEMIQSIIILD